MADTAYATEIAHADYDDARIERLHVHENGREEIRFSWWPNGKFVPRPLDLPEDELLPLLKLAIKKGVFTEHFLDNLQAVLSDRNANT